MGETDAGSAAKFWQSSLESLQVELRADGSGLDEASLAEPKNTMVSWTRCCLKDRRGWRYSDRIRRGLPSSLSRNASSR